MRALFWDGERAKVEEIAEPEVPDGYALVRVRRAGICNTDLEITRGYMGFRGVLGHELCGDVIEGPAEWVGQRVAAEINFGCGGCTACRKGLDRHCPNRAVMGIVGANGCMAERIAVPVRNLHRVPSEISDDAAVFVEPLAAAFEILEQVHVEPGASCVVLGDGKLGLLVSLVLHGAGALVLSVGKHRDKLAILERAGIKTTVWDAWRREQADLVVEATGRSEGILGAIEATKPRGTLVLKSTVAGESKLHLAPIVIHEIRLVGSRCGPFGPALRALAAGRIDPTPLLTARRSLADGVNALAEAASPGALKIIVDPSG